MNKKNSCYLIGEDHLVIQCGEILVTEGYPIAGVFSPLAETHQWAVHNNIPYYSSYKTFEDVLLNNQFDYLFSIVNSKIIPVRILKNIKKLAINYHDGPLPKYGGANATGFAILNHEKNHGVTWHIIDDVIDGGDILKQSFFKIDPEETAFSLNIKCYQQGLSLFRSLVTELNQNSYQLTKQNLEKKIYHRLENKPTYNGWLSWHNSAENIERTFRAFDMGNYKNKFSTLKFTLGEQNYIVLDLKISTNKSMLRPGTITDVSNNQWKVSTQTNDILLLSISTIYGEKKTMSSLVDLHHIKVGHRLYSPPIHLGNEFKKASEKIYENEQFWVTKYRQFNRAEFPFLNFSNELEPSGELKIVSSIKISKKLLKNINQIIQSAEEITDFFLTVWVIYLFRLGNVDNNEIMITREPLYSNKFKGMISDSMPFNISLNDNMSFHDALCSIKKLGNDLSKKTGFLKDIFMRYPELGSAKNTVTMAVVYDDCDIKEFFNVLIFNISLKNNTLSWILDGNIIENMPFASSSTKKISIHFSTLMQSIFLNPWLKIKDMDYLSPKEKNKIIKTWNATETKYDSNKLIHHRISEISITRPNKTAVFYNNKAINYQMLDHKANQLAHYLIKKSFARKNIIVHLERSIELIIVILGIMKSGSTYVPVPTSSPAKNIELIIHDSRAPLILTQDTFSQKLQKTTSVHVDILCIENIWQTIENMPSTDPMIQQVPNDLAYIIYTSGTTGAPKGVMIRHDGLINLIIATIHQLKISSTTRFLQFSSISFDASIWEIFSALSAGSTLFIPNQEELLVGDSLKNYITQYNINCIIVPPSILQTMTHHCLPTLKTVVAGGEFCSRELANNWSHRVNLINAYGPTEATVCICMSKIHQNTRINPPIGKPISNIQVYVLDNNLNLLPTGAVGELYIGGDGLSNGYLNKEELTHQFFISNPYSKGRLLYKTRDLVRWLPNGEMEYIGRIDNQVKIRGFRVELEAIESQILHDEHVEQCAVTVQERKGIGKYLVAYVSSENTALSLDKVRHDLKNVLPDYMIPSFFMRVSSMPLTINGKIDKKKLPSYDPNRRVIDDNYQRPKTNTEKKLTKIWSNLLNMTTIGTQDNFFDLGGHSLILTLLSTYLLDEFNYSLSLQRFLKHPTISHLGQLIDNKHEPMNKITLHERIVTDKILSPDINPLTQKNTNIGSILITGATGFLGIHMLHNLLHMTDTKIFCLVRSKSPQHGLDKVQNELVVYHLDVQTSRGINVICGDLSKPKLGLSDLDYNFLSNEIDMVYHNGAHVHHLYDYGMLRSSNVEGTIELLKFCALKKNKALHYISTLSAITNGQLKNNTIQENFVDFSLDIPIEMNGYNQTKLMSEYLLAQANARGINVHIYRPGWIMGQCKTGIINPQNNHLLLLLKGCIQLGIAPEWDVLLNILPVDFVSQFIIKVSLEKKLKNKVYNLCNNHLKISWKQLIDFFNSNGFPIQMVSPIDWRHELLKINRSNALYNLLSLYRDEDALQQQMRVMHSKISTKNKANALKYIGFNLHFVKNELLSNYMKFLKTHKFI